MAFVQHVHCISLNLMEVMKEVSHEWWELGGKLGVPLPKRDAMRSPFLSDGERMRLVVDHFLRQNSIVTWKEVAGTLRPSYRIPQSFSNCVCSSLRRACSKLPHVPSYLTFQVTPTLPYFIHLSLLSHCRKRLSNVPGINMNTGI